MLYAHLPMDQAKGVLSLIQAKHPDKGYDVDEVMSELMRVQLSPENLSEDTIFTVNMIAQISGKSYPTLFRTLSLLKLSPEIQVAIQAGNLSVSQGYLFAANLDCPDRAKIFTDIMKTPVTNPVLNNLLTAYKKVKPDSGDTKPPTMTKQIAVLRSFRSYMEMNTAQYMKPDLEVLIEDLRTFLALVGERVQTAPEPAPEKPVTKKLPQV